jgi:ribose-phosphate pyrophosphokinase
MKTLVMALPGAAVLAGQLCTSLGAEAGTLDLHRFRTAKPARSGAVAGRARLVLLAPLARPDQRLLALYLVAPYLPYMRQDAVFAPGQGVTSRHVARLLSGAATGW